MLKNTDDGKCTGSPSLLDLPDILYDSPIPTSSSKLESSCSQKDASETPWNVFLAVVCTDFCEGMRED